MKDVANWERTTLTSFPRLRWPSGFFSCLQYNHFCTAGDKTWVRDLGTIEANFAGSLSVGKVSVIRNVLPAVTFSPFAVEISSFSYEQMPATAQLQITFLGVVDTSVFRCNLSALMLLNTSSPMDPYSVFFSPRYPGRCGQVTNSTIVAYLDSRDYITLLALGIFSSVANSYLTWKKTLLGPLLTVTETEVAYQAQTFVPQTHQVIILGFDLDFNAGQLLIHFGSIMDIASTDVSGVTVSNGNATQDVSLTGGDIVSDSYATTVCIDMTNEDLLNIHNREICTSLENCFATFSSGFALDAFGNTGDVRTLKVFTTCLKTTLSNIIILQFSFLRFHL